MIKFIDQKYEFNLNSLFLMMSYMFKNVLKNLNDSFPKSI